MRIIKGNNHTQLNIIKGGGKTETIKMKHMSKTKTEEHIYPCAYMVNINSDIKCYYSSILPEYYNQPKLIIGDGIFSKFYFDKKGEYGLTQFCYAILGDIDYLKDLKEYLDTEEFHNLNKYLDYSVNNNKFNYRVLRLFKNNFYK